MNSPIYMCTMSNLCVNCPALGDLDLHFTPLAADDLMANWRGKLGTSSDDLTAGAAGEVKGDSIAMSDTTFGLDQMDEETLTYDVSDEALETAAGAEKSANYTLGACSGFSVCPS